MAIVWDAEACELGPDPQTGAWITRMTSTVMSNINIYYEQPYGTPDGRRFAYLRAPGADPRRPPGQQLCVGDLETIRVCLIDDQVRSNMVATSSWSGKVFYLRANGELILVDLTTLDKQIALTHWPLPMDAAVCSVSPDLRYLASSFQDHEFMFNLARIDLHSGQVDVIYRHEDVHGHIQINHVDGRDILLQRNRGLRANHLGQRRHEPAEHTGATHVLIDLDGGNERQLRLGEPWTAQSTGHASWVAGTGRVALPVQTVHGIQVGAEKDRKPVEQDHRHPEGNFLVVAPGEAPRAFPAPGQLFMHAAMSRCGRYFVADGFRHGLPAPVEIVMGNIETGKHRVLVSDIGGRGGGPACAHPHPYLTADNRHVIYNADPYLVGHVHAARVDDAFRQSLE